MKLTKLKKAIKKFVSKDSKGKKVKSKKVAKVINELKSKEKRLKKAYDDESSKKKREDITLKLKIVNAQIKKARKLISE